MGNAKGVKLRNAPTAPASDDALVEALLAFVSGSQIVVVEQGMGKARSVDGWSRTANSASADDRKCFAGVLEAAMQGEREIGESETDVLGVPPTLQPMVSDYFDGTKFAADDGFIHIRQGQLWIESTDRHGGLSSEFEPFGKAIDSPLWLKDFAPYVADLRRTLRFMPLVRLRGGSYTFIQYAVFATISAAMTVAALTVLDSSKPFRGALARCKLPTCGGFYLARKNPAGGPANRTYCSPAHRDEHHNSAARKGARKAPVRRAK